MMFNRTNIKLFAIIIRSLCAAGSAPWIYLAIAKRNTQYAIALTAYTLQL